MGMGNFQVDLKGICVNAFLSPMLINIQILFVIIYSMYRVIPDANLKNIKPQKSMKIEQLFK